MVYILDVLWMYFQDSECIVTQVTNIVLQIEEQVCFQQHKIVESRFLRLR